MRMLLRRSASALVSLAVKCSSMAGGTGLISGSSSLNA
jgi:hypothetical protein